MPGTFSMRTTQAPDWTTMRLAADQRSRASADPRRFPATECGWHGMPPMRPSTHPRQRRPLKVRASLHTGAGARRPSSIAETSRAAPKASLSTMQTEREPGTASSTPRSSPPPPVQMLMKSRRSEHTAMSPLVSVPAVDGFCVAGLACRSLGDCFVERITSDPNARQVLSARGKLLGFSCELKGLPRL